MKKKCLEKPKIKKKHVFPFVGIPTFGEGRGGQAGWDKIPTWNEN